MVSLAKSVALALTVGILAACSSSTTPSGSGGGASTASHPVPASIVGSWYAGAGGTTMPYDPSTGTFGTPDGEGLVYVFRADGSYTKAFQSYVTTGGCTTGFTAQESGAINVSGNAIDTMPKQATVKYTASCSPSMNSEKPGQLNPESFTYGLDAGQLVLVSSTGSTGRFRPIAN